VVGQVDEDVVGRVVSAVPGQIDALAADLDRAVVLEGLVVRLARRVVVAEQEVACLLVPDPGSRSYRTARLRRHGQRGDVSR
jgi:hypothetical protein